MTIALATILSVSCTKEKGNKVTATAVTLDATDVTFRTMTFSATFTIGGDGNTPCAYGILIGSEAGLTDATGIFTSLEYEFHTGTYNYVYNFNNVLGDIIPIVKFLPGQELFYRAAIKLDLGDESRYIYGEEKSLIVPLQ